MAVKLRGIGDLPSIYLLFRRGKIPPRLGGKPVRDRYLVWTRFVGVGSGGIRTHNLLGDVRTSRLARLSVHTTEPLARLIAGVCCVVTSGV